jgi:hypothetical protein
LQLQRQHILDDLRLIHTLKRSVFHK